MTADAFSFKKDARLPSRIVTLSGNGLADLSTIDANTMLFVYRLKGDTVRKTITATITSIPLMKIQVDFASIDTQNLGKYEWHIEAQITGKKMYWPEKGFYTFSVTDNIE
jgi:hypothetical protein